MRSCLIKHRFFIFFTTTSRVMSRNKTVNKNKKRERSNISLWVACACAESPEPVVLAAPDISTTRVLRQDMYFSRSSRFYGRVFMEAKRTHIGRVGAYLHRGRSWLMSYQLPRVSFGKYLIWFLHTMTEQVKSLIKTRHTVIYCLLTI